MAATRGRRRARLGDAGSPWRVVDDKGGGAAAAAALDGGDELRCTLGEYRQLPGAPTARVGEDEASQPWIGEEQHEEKPSPAMAAATSLCDSDAMAGSLVVELRQEDSRRGKGFGGELAMKNEARGRKNWATAALGAF
jgi:hypothetical protein